MGKTRQIGRESHGENMTDRNYLFHEFDLRGTLENQEKTMLQEIESIDANRLLNTSESDLLDYFEEKFKVEVPRLLEEHITTDQQESQVEVSQEFNRFISDESGPFYVPGTKVSFFVPFEGDPMLFRCQSSSMISFNPPRADIRGNELVVTFTVANHDAQAIKTQFNGTLSQIKELLTATASDAGIYNGELRKKAEVAVERRKQKLLKDQGLVADLGYPLRKREGAPTTYAVPVTPKKVVPIMPPASTAPYKPEPTLEWGEYENILSIITSMVKVMERSPKSFTTMREEDIRQHFLVQLNGQYQGKATGETFNESGKTDILIREEDKNIFIAECKFWEGQESFLKALSQLLGYTSWRDTKIALLIFNRNKNLSDVLARIPDIVKQHPNFKKQLDYQSETGFRFVLHHNDDKNREIFVTVLFFEIPKEQETSK